MCLGEYILVDAEKMQKRGFHISSLMLLSGFMETHIKLQFGVLD